MSSMIGTTISHYRVPEKLGTDSLSLCGAQDACLERFDALKLLPDAHPLISDRIHAARTMNHTSSAVAERGWAIS
jgi:hypothetical protein